MADVTNLGTSKWSKFTNFVETMSTWKKVLISIVVVLAILTGYTLGVYFKGYHDGLAQCKPTKPVELKPSDHPKEHTEYYKNIVVTSKKKKTSTKVDPKICGEKMIISAKYNGKDKIEVVSKDNCKSTTKYFDFVYQCPLVRNQIGLGLGSIFVYDNAHSKFTPLVGGAIKYTRWWGNFGLSPQVGGYGAIDKTMFAASAHLFFDYKW